MVGKGRMTAAALEASLEARRKKTGPHGIWRTWEHDLLGKIPDSEIAEKTGRSLRSIVSRRSIYKIKAKNRSESQRQNQERATKARWGIRYAVRWDSVAHQDQKTLAAWAGASVVRLFRESRIGKNLLAWPADWIVAVANVLRVGETDILQFPDFSRPVPYEKRRLFLEKA